MKAVNDKERIIDAVVILQTTGSKQTMSIEQMLKEIAKIQKIEITEKDLFDMTSVAEGILSK